MVPPQVDTGFIINLPFWASYGLECMLYPNLNFTVKNKMGNLHKIRLFTFQSNIQCKIVNEILPQILRI